MCKSLTIYLGSTVLNLNTHLDKSQSETKHLNFVLKDPKAEFFDTITNQHYCNLLFE